MKICINHPFCYEMENLCRLFFPFDKIEVVHEGEEGAVASLWCRRETDTELVAYNADRSVRKNGFVSNTHPEYEKECERTLGVALFEVLREMTGRSPQWGILTGVRPAKLMRQLMAKDGEQACLDYFRDKLLVSEEKIDLCRQVVATESKITALSRPDSYSLYISIPFCPSRCGYCSFVSHTVERAKHLIPPYVELLCRELEATAAVARECRLRLETVYIGGGTPTVLSPDQLEQLLRCVDDCFDLSRLREYTVEAGRPDTITSEKLAVVRDHPVTRISVNPQTMRDSVLEAIGRRHTSEQTRKAVALAREAEFDNINMDLIAGLPGDSAAGFADTINEILALSPESVTVHTLAVKRSSAYGGTMRLAGPGRDDHGRETETMLALAGQQLRETGYIPYYLYRQSRTVGNLENTGYAKQGTERVLGYYNVYMMDETHTVLGCGANAVTKLKDPHGPHIERIFNYKYPYEYIGHFEEMTDPSGGYSRSKQKVGEFYEQYPI